MSRSCVLNVLVLCLKKDRRSQVSEDQTLKKTDEPNRSVRSETLPSPRRDWFENRPGLARIDDAGSGWPGLRDIRGVWIHILKFSTCHMEYLYINLEY